MAESIGITLPPVDEKDQFRLQGLEPSITDKGLRWIRLACLYPEKVDRVEFFRNGALYYTCYDEPFMVHWCCNFDQTGVETRPEDREWRAVAHLRDGRRIEKKETL